MKRAAPTAGVLSLVIVWACALTAPAGASIIKGSLVFQDNAFADQAAMLNGSVGLHAAATVQEALAGDFLGSYIEAFDAGEILEVGFADNYMFNGPGADLAVFEALAINNFRVAVYTAGHASPTPYRAYTPERMSGFVDGLTMNVAAIDLDEFGLPPNARVTWVLIQSDDVNSAEIAGVGALNSLPEPATLALMGLGAACLLWRRSRR